MTHKKRFMEILDEALKDFMVGYNVVTKVISDKEGIIIGASLVSDIGNNDVYDANVVYRISRDDILEKDITMTSKAYTATKELREALIQEALNKYRVNQRSD